MVLHKSGIIPLIFLMSFLPSSAADDRYSQWASTERYKERPAWNINFSPANGVPTIGESLNKWLYSGSSARSPFTPSRDYTYEDFKAGRSINGVDMSGLSRKQQWELIDMNKRFQTASNYFDIDRMGLERTKLHDILSLEGIPMHDRVFYTKALQLLETHTGSTQFSEFRNMVSTDNEKDAKESFNHLKWLHRQGLIDDEKFDTIQAEYNNRSEVKELHQRLLTSCDFITTGAGCTRDEYAMDMRLQNKDIEIPVFDEVVEWSKVTRYINAHMATTALMVEQSGEIGWEQWGALNAEAIQQVMHPVIAAAGTAHGAADSVVGPMVDVGKGICNLMVEAMSKQFDVDVDTPMHDAFEQWIEDSRDLYETDPYQAGFNFGGAMTKTALPFVQSANAVRNTRIAAYKKTLSTCKNAKTASNSACIVM